MNSPLKSFDDCSFCAPTEDDVVILETPFARVICDARPAMIGHVLVTSASHSPSTADITEPEFSGLRVVQQEISRRMKVRLGEVGVYEHGRSITCRFHDINKGYIHAHLHVLPVSFDLISRSGYEQKWQSQLPPAALGFEDRYLYQEIGERPSETWAKGRLPVQRHFVRSQLQDVLKDRTVPWLPLESSPDAHDDAVEATAAILNAYDQPPEVKRVAIAGPDTSLNQIAGESLATAFGVPVDVVQDPRDDSFEFRLWLMKTSESDQFVYDQQPSFFLPLWNDVRITVNNLDAKQLLDTVAQAWRIRFGTEL